MLLTNLIVADSSSSSSSSRSVCGSIMFPNDM